MIIGNNYYIVTGSYQNSVFALVRLVGDNNSFIKSVELIEQIVVLPLNDRVEKYFHANSRDFYEDEDFKHALEEFARIQNFKATEYGFVKFLFEKAK